MPNRKKINAQQEKNQCLAGKKSMPSRKEINEQQEKNQWPVGKISMLNDIIQIKNERSYIDT